MLETGVFLPQGTECVLRYNSQPHTGERRLDGKGREISVERNRVVRRYFAPEMYNGERL